MNDKLIINRGYEKYINNVAIQSGAISISEDGRNIYLDSKDGSKRIKITDIIDISNLEELSPKEELGTGIMYNHYYDVTEDILTSEISLIPDTTSFLFEIQPNSKYYVSGSCLANSTRLEDITTQPHYSIIGTQYTLPLVIFYDAERVAIDYILGTNKISEDVINSGIGQTDYVNNYEITTPENAKYMSINYDMSSEYATLAVKTQDIIYFPNKIYIDGNQLKKYNESTKQLEIISDLNSTIIYSNNSIQQDLDNNVEYIKIDKDERIGSIIIDNNGNVGIIKNIGSINNDKVAYLILLKENDTKTLIANCDIYFDDTYEGIQTGTIFQPFNSWNNLINYVDINGNKLLDKLQNIDQSITIHILSNAILTINGTGGSGLNNVKFMGYNSTIKFNGGYVFSNCENLTFELLTCEETGKNLTDEMSSTIFNNCKNIKFNNCVDNTHQHFNSCENVNITNSSLFAFNSSNSTNLFINNCDIKTRINCIDNSGVIICNNVKINELTIINNESFISNNPSNNITVSLSNVEILGRFHIDNINQLNLISGYCNNINDELAINANTIYLGCFDFSQITNINDVIVSDFLLNHPNITCGGLNSLQVYDDNKYLYGNTGPTLKEHLFAIDNKLSNLLDPNNPADMTTLNKLNENISTNADAIKTINDNINGINDVINNIKNGIRINDFKSVETELDALNKLLKDSDGNQINLQELSEKVKELNNMINGNEMLEHWLITTDDSTTFKEWVVPKTGEYQIIVVGSGGNAAMYDSNTKANVQGGGSGGISVLTKSLNKGDIYYIKTISTLTRGESDEPNGYSVFSNTKDIGKSTTDTTHTINVSSTETCEASINQYISNNNINICMIAYNGNTGTAGSSSTSRQYGKPGVAFGGDINYEGNYSASMVPADVGVYIPYLMKKNTRDVYDSDINDGNSTVRIESGYGILGYGCATGWYTSTSTAQTKNKGGCVLIIPKN